MADQDARVVLSVDRTGDAGAIRETADDLRELGDQATVAVPGVDQLGGEVAELGDKSALAGTELGRMFDGLDAKVAEAKTGVAGVNQEVEKSGPAAKSGGAAFLEFAGKVALAGAAISTAKSVVGEIEQSLNSLALQVGGTGDEFSGLSDALTGPFQIMKKSLDDSVLAMTDWRLAWDEHIGTTDKEIANHEAVRTALEAVRTKRLEEKAALEGQAAAQKEWLESLGPTAETLGEQATALTEHLQKVGDAAQLNPAQQEAVKAQITALLAEYARIGTEAPAALQSAADAWGVIPAAAEAAATASAAAAEKIKSSLLGAFAATKEEVAATSAAIVASLSGINIPDLKLVDPEQFDAAKQKVQQLVDQYRIMGEKVPPEVEKVAGSMGILLRAFDVEGSITPFATATDDAATSLNFFTMKAKEGEGTIKSWTNLVGESNVQLTAASTAGEAASMSMTGMASTLTTTGAAAATAAPKIAEVDTAAGDSATSTGDAATAAADLAASTTAAATGSGQLAGNLAAADSALGSAEGKFVALGTAMDGIAQKDFSTSIIAQLNKIEAAAVRTEAAIKRLNGDGDGAAPAAPSAPKDTSPGGGGKGP